MITVTREEIEQFRYQLANYPEALAALNEIEEEEGDLEYATEIIASEAGIDRIDIKESWLQNLARRCRHIICQDEFKNDLLAGGITTLIPYLVQSVNLPVALATPVAIYIVKIGVKSFCNQEETRNHKDYPLAQELIADNKGNIEKVLIDFQDYERLIESFEDEGLYRAMMEVKDETPLSLEEALAELDKE
ncbi:MULTISPECIES: hypothetical protein [unclassified Moorena]|uniref:hypothetical protein n=1 Tax=unclassified Moorena TaxID=2683338 RepID=UPI00257E7E59|nr:MULTISPECIES: hypothetical protein [unclassified Moorena]